MLGAEVHKVPTVPYSNPNQYQKVAGRLAAIAAERDLGEPVRQHRRIATRIFSTTGPEIWSQTERHASMRSSRASGTGGTIAGVSEYLKSQNPNVRCVLADPPGSSLYEYVKNGALKATGTGSITEGIGIAPRHRELRNRADRRCRAHRGSGDRALRLSPAARGRSVPRQHERHQRGRRRARRDASSARATRSSPCCAMAARSISPVCSTPSGSRRRDLARFAAAPAGARADYLGESPCRLNARSSPPSRTPSSSEPAPVGLFQVFELGLLGLRAELIDSLPAIGGQCTELYPDKPIYDIPAVPVCTARELIERLAEQIKPFNAGVHLGQEVTSVVQRREDGRFDVETSRGTRFDAGTVIIAGGRRLVPAAQARRAGCGQASKARPFTIA